MFSTFDKLLSDGNSDVRDCMAKTIGKLKILIEEDFFESLEKNLNKTVVNKVSDVM